MSTLSADNKKENGFRMHANPVLSRLSGVKERAEDQRCATYGGIFAKTGYFLLITLISVLLYCILNQTVFVNTPGADLTLLQDSEDAAVITVHFAMPEMIIGVICSLMTLIMPFVCAFSISATPVCGTLYCFSEGYCLALIIFKFLGMRNIPTSIGLVALALTILVVAVMGFLYTKRIVKVNQKFYTILFSVVGAVVLTGLLTFVLSLIPFTRPLVASFASNPVLGTIACLISVVLASLFLLSDFAVVEQCVESKYPARYEWMASFGLAFTVLWLYLKILELLVRLLGNKNN